MKGVILALLLAATLGKEPPPNVDDVAYGVNVLRGLPPAEHSTSYGRKMFRLTGDMGDVSGYIHYEQFYRMSEGAHCEYKESSEGVQYATSSSSLKSQQKSSSYGFEQETSLSVSVPAGPVEVGAETTVRNALMVGNSKSSVEASSKHDAGYEYSFDSYAQRQLYSVEVNYDNIDSWTEDFKNKCEALGENPSNEQILQFFRDYGTHGLRKAAFGQKCTSSVFMKGGTSINSYTNFKEDTSSYDAQFHWFKASGSTTKSEETKTYDQYGISAKFADRRCEGEIATGSSCSGTMIASGRDSPAIIKWSYKSIWTMNIPTLTAGAKNRLQNVYQELVNVFTACGKTKCSNHGACAPNAALWGLPELSLNLMKEYLKNPSTCFCFDGFEGNDCKKTEKIQVFGSTPVGSFFQTFNSIHDNPLCGVLSIFWPFHDRMFSLTTCDIQPENHPIDSTQSLAVNSLFQSGSLECPNDSVLIGLNSNYFEIFNDRMWVGRCAHFGGTKTSGSYWTGYQNGLEKSFDFQCPDGMVLAGIGSYYASYFHDRMYKFFCTQLRKSEEFVLQTFADENKVGMSLAKDQVKMNQTDYLHSKYTLNEENGEGEVREELRDEININEVEGQNGEHSSNDQNESENGEDLPNQPMARLQVLQDDIASIMKDLEDDVIIVADAEDLVEVYGKELKKFDRYVEGLPEEDAANVMMKVNETEGIIQEIKTKTKNAKKQGGSVPSEETESKAKKQAGSVPGDETEPKAKKQDESVHGEEHEAEVEEYEAEVIEYALRGSYAGESQNIAPDDYEKIALTLSELGLPQDKIEKVLYELMSDNE